MKKFFIKLAIALVASISVFGYVVRVVLETFLPAQEFSWFVFIPLLFLLLGLGTVAMLYLFRKKDDTKLVNIYLLLKMLKLLLVIVFFGTAYFIIKENFKIFALTFIAFYVIYLVGEIFIFYFFEKQKKKILLNNTKF